MADPTLAGEVKDWLTSVAIVVGGAWAMWLFGHAEWLRRRSEIPTLEGNSFAPEIVALADGCAVASLRWTWRNAGSRPVYVDGERSIVEVYRLTGNIGEFVDPRQHKETLASHKIAVHYPLKGYGFYLLEPNTNSSILTLPILPLGEAFIARHRLVANQQRHPTGFKWSYSWERWQVFRTDLPEPNIAKTQTADRIE
jgi:hypothetical protein